MIKCSKCNIKKKNEDFYFVEHRQQYRTVCKECESAYGREYRIGKKRATYIDKDGTILCNLCDHRFTPDKFHWVHRVYYGWYYKTPTKRQRKYKNTDITYNEMIERELKCNPRAVCIDCEPKMLAMKGDDRAKN